MYLLQYVYREEERKELFPASIWLMSEEAGDWQGNSALPPHICAEHCTLTPLQREPQGGQCCFKISGVLVLGFYFVLEYLENSIPAEWHFLRGETAENGCSSWCPGTEWTLSGHVGWPAVSAGEQSQKAGENFCESVYKITSKDYPKYVEIEALYF